MPIVSVEEALTLAAVVAGAALSQTFQTFGRRLLHYTPWSHRTLWMSATRLVAVVAVLSNWSRLPVAPVAIPLVALLFGDVMLLAALAGTSWRDLRGGQLAQEPTTAKLMRRGRWLVGAEGLSRAAGFAVSNLVVALAGAPLLGAAEAARVVAQPLRVAMTGLNWVVNPRIMEARIRGAHHRSDQLVRFVGAATVVGAVLYGSVVIPDWPINLFRSLIPVAYRFDHLVLVSIAAVGVTVVAVPLTTELMASQREQDVFTAERLSVVVAILCGLTAPITGAFARPLSMVGSGLVRAWRLRALVTRH